MNPVLEVNNLTKTFGSFTALDHLSFSMKEGEILGMLGPNGAGKTTTIQMLLGVMAPASGDIRFFGKEFEKNREYILKNINFASTYISLPWRFTVIEILNVFAKLYEIPNQKYRIERLLKEFDLEDLRKRSYSDLSAGEKTRLVLTKSFLNYPKIVLLDEPTASLDPEIAVRIRRFLKKQNEDYKVSILFTSHNMAEVEEMCDRILILNHGKIIDEGRPEKLAKNITDCEIELTIVQHKNRAIKFFNANDIPYELDRYRFTLLMDESRVADFLMVLADEKIKFQEISIRKPDLEDYFLKKLGVYEEND